MCSPIGPAWTRMDPPSHNTPPTLRLQTAPPEPGHQPLAPSWPESRLQRAQVPSAQGDICSLFAFAVFRPRQCERMATETTQKKRTGMNRVSPDCPGACSQDHFPTGSGARTPLPRLSTRPMGPRWNFRSWFLARHGSTATNTGHSARQSP